MDRSKIIKIVGISVAILLIAVIFPLNLTYGSFNKTANLIITKQYNALEEIKITSIDSDIEIITTEESTIKLDVYDRNEKNIEISNKNDILNVTNKKECKNCEKSKIVIYIPNNYNGKFNLLTDSGNIKVDSAVNIKANSNSGNIVINNVSSLEGETTSGNLLIESLNNSIKYKSNKGEVIINNAIINSESNIETTTGRIKIDTTNNIRVRVTSFNSQASVKSNRNSNTILNVKTYNGIIDIK